LKRYIREHSAKLPKIVRLEVGAFKANCYLVYDSEGNCAVIDPGDDADFIEEKIRELNLVPKLVLLTHGHSDHVTAAPDIALAYPVPVYLNSKDAFLFRKASRFPGKLTGLKEGELLKAGELRVKVLEIPGHTPGSVALNLMGTPHVFCGDIFFADGSLGRTDFGYSDRRLMEESIKKLGKLPKKTIFHPGHGEEFENL
jgi:glyoxylase-like metal-dependent hydrolase (beta-lactamase superfamily II)